MSFEQFIDQLNAWGRHRIPFLFLLDFEKKKPLAWKLSEVDPSLVLYDFNGVTNAVPSGDRNKDLRFQRIHPLEKCVYETRFKLVKKHLEYGDTFLTNLTVRSEVTPGATLRQMFDGSAARYKLMVNDSFLVFSPEIFVQVFDGKIYSYPMKGTIDASLPNARQRILDDGKELAEHVTIVDLIRNDLSMVAQNVQVSRFRYIDEINTKGKKLLQVSSEIVGFMKERDFSAIGSVIASLVPAGSVSGAPKPKTLEIIRAAEEMERGYYTGVAGIFDGEKFDSGVMIRFIEKEGDRFFYRSGGGITTQSELDAEYQEAIDKIYVPVH